VQWVLYVKLSSLEGFNNRLAASRSESAPYWPNRWTFCLLDALRRPWIQPHLGSGKRGLITGSGEKTGTIQNGWMWQRTRQERVWILDVTELRDTRAKLSEGASTAFA